MELHPDTEKLHQKIQKCLKFAGPWAGTFYRATTLEYANRHDLLAGVGSRKAGGRWNARRSFNAIYGCLEPETAISEALANYRDYGIPVTEAMPLVFVAITVKLQAVFDFTTPAVQKRLSVSHRRMKTTPWRSFQERGEEAVTQTLGRIVWEEHLEAILIPSARVNSKANIVVFPRRRQRGSSWKIKRSRQLPKQE